jgi:hypothetical protein
MHIDKHWFSHSDNHEILDTYLYYDSKREGRKILGKYFQANHPCYNQHTTASCPVLFYLTSQ